MMGTVLKPSDAKCYNRQNPLEPMPLFLIQLAIDLSRCFLFERYCCMYTFLILLYWSHITVLNLGILFATLMYYASGGHAVT
jgi:hypothetical protein